MRYPDPAPMLSTRTLALVGLGLAAFSCLAIAFLFLAFSCLDLSFLCLDLGSPSFCLFTASLIDMHSVAAKCTA